MRTVLALTFCVFVFILSADALQCHAPNYREGAVWERSESSVFMAVSISLKDFAPAKLLCLAQVFRQRYPNQKSIKVLILSSRDAARRTIPYRVGDDAPFRNGMQQKFPSLSSWLGALHGFYSYSAEKQDEHLDIRPFGSDFEGGPDDTRIALPTTDTPRCHLEISDRCLLALEHIIYPDGALTRSVAGTVTLTGLIERSGKVSGIHAVEIRVEPEPSVQKEMLVDEAVRNLKTWRFEPSSGKDKVRITYSYLIDPTLPVPTGYRKFTKVQLELPNQITIYGRNLE